MIPSIVWLLCVSSAMFAWPGDLDGDGREDLMDYRAAQIMHGRLCAEASGLVLRGDLATLAIGRDMAVHVVDVTGHSLGAAPVEHGLWAVMYPADLAVELECRGPDMRCERVGDGFVCYWDIYVEAGR